MPSIPDGATVETLCVVMAAANGMVWEKTDEDLKGAMRRMAAGALISWAIRRKGAAAPWLCAKLTGIAQACERAARFVEAEQGDERLIQALVIGAAQLEDAVAVLAGMKTVEEAEEAI